MCGYAVHSVSVAVMVRGSSGENWEGERKGEVDVYGVSWSSSDVAQDFAELFGGGHDGNDGTIVGRERV